MKHYWFTKSQQHLIGHDCKTENCPEMSESDIIEMQKIDADCNDCKHFKRGKMHRRIGYIEFDGHCMKYDHPTWAAPGQFTGRVCFEHRRE